MTVTSRVATRRRGLALHVALVLMAGLLAAAPVGVADATSGSAAGASGGAGSPAGAFSTPLPIPEEYTDSDITLTAQEAEVDVLDGPATRMWTFDGTFPGPVIRRPAGEETRVTFVNDLPEEAGSLTIHNHGNHSAPEHDGLPGPEYAIERGEQRTYVYEGMEAGEPKRGAMQWYHDHTHHRTGLNTWMGLAGMYIIEHPLEEELGLPSGERDVPLMITDRSFDDDNQLVTGGFTGPERGDAAPHEAVGAGFPPFDEVIGSRHLVNGAARPYLDVEPRAYRLRVLNASNFRPYNLALDNGDELTQVATESGLLPEPVDREQILLGPAERAEIVIDFSRYEGQKLVLGSTPADDAGPLGATGATDADLMQFRVSGDAHDEHELPEQLRPLPDWVAEASSTPDRIWTFGLNPSQTGKMAWTVNGREFEHGRIDARPEIDSVETWMLVNTSPPGFSHYIHLHHTDWVMLSRNGESPEAYEAGPKETFRIDPGEAVVVAARFSDYLGPYMFHCHMLEHEDHGMMAAFEVVEEGEGDLLPAASSLVGGEVSVEGGHAGLLDDLPPGERERTERILDDLAEDPGAVSPAPASFGTGPDGSETPESPEDAPLAAEPLCRLPGAGERTLIGRRPR